MLAEYGEFHPYGGFMKDDGMIVHAGAEDPASDYPRAVTLLELLRRDFARRARIESIKAIAFVTDTRLEPPNNHNKTNAVQVTIEHRDSYCAEVFFPYVIDDSGRLEFGNAFAQRGEPTILGSTRPEIS